MVRLHLDIAPVLGGLVAEAHDARIVAEDVEATAAYAAHMSMIYLYPSSPPPSSC